MKINCYIALVAAALACACNPLADTDDMDNNVQATRIAFSPEVVTLDNAGRNAGGSGTERHRHAQPKARRSMAWSAETDKTETWCTLTECSVTDADGVTHRGFGSPRPKIRPTNAATVTLTAADEYAGDAPGRADGRLPRRRSHGGRSRSSSTPTRSSRLMSASRPTWATSMRSPETRTPTGFRGRIWAAT
ncbi:MAG: hypothetical protein ACLRMJ_03105 [Alistipes finegoldii]